MYISYFSLVLRASRLGAVPKGERSWFPLAIPALPQEHASPQGRRANAQSLQPPKIFKVTVAIFDCSLLVTDQGGNVLIGKALN